ncbi:LysR family transcriptional regulator ArgP [Pseudooceanicola onchidii]|uniref:LysR family transcriptional regulator ArgP n=1 Tax=Pseudooceanicola onchidii TaxID=2562279 RepID=UPI0010AA4857|nr:LysR family transcriptional regulator ArgP [Pseudooceanicola onchidii]
MYDYLQLHTLAAILRHGSFDAAAGELNLSQSAVSQRLRALEDRVGQPLVIRGTPCSGTEMGQRLARHVEEVGLMEARLSGDLGLRFPDTPRARITVNADSLASWIVPALAEARLALPDMLFDVVVDDQEHSAESLKRGEVVGAVTSTEDPPTGCDSYPLGSLRYIATASPRFMKRYFAQGVTGAALEHAPMLTYDKKDRLQLDWLAHNFGVTRMPPTHYLPSTTAFVEAARRGLGWGMNPEMLVRRPLADRLLVPLIQSSAWDTPLFWQTPRRLRNALAPLTLAIRKVAADHLYR